MKIASYTKGKYLVLRIHPHGEDFPDLSELKDLIVGYLDVRGPAISRSISSTRPIFTAGNCGYWSPANFGPDGGNLCIVEPNPTVFGILSPHIDKMIKIYASEEFLD